MKRQAAAWVALGVGLVLSILASIEVKRDIEQDAVNEFAFTSDQVTLKIQERLNSYELILRGGAALFAASVEVNRQEWRAYVDTLRASGSVPGVQGIGFAQAIPANQLAAHIASIRSQGFPEYNVRPAGERALYTSIIYLEPFSDRNLRAFGYDMFSEPVRHAAMERARDSDLAVLSGKVILVQETSTEVQAGTLMYVPVYWNGMPHATVEQRRAALIGWTYSPYRMNDLMAGILSDWDHLAGQYIDLHIYDGTEAAPASLLFDAPDAPNLLHSHLRQQRTLDFNGHHWLLVFDQGSAAAGMSYASAWATLIGGIALSSLLYGLILSLASTQARARVIASTLTEEIRQSENLLRESEFRWRFAIDGSGDGLWDWNIADSMVFFSTRWKEMLGYSETEIGNGLDEWEKRIHPEDKADTLAAVQAHLDGKSQIYVSEHRVQCKDGSYKWILDRGIVVNRSEDGKPLRVIGTQNLFTISALTAMIVK